MNYITVREKVRVGLEPPVGSLPKWTPNGPLRDVPGIGSYFAQRFARPDVPGGAAITPADVARRVNHWLAGMSRARRREGLIRFLGTACQNRRASTCVGSYLVRDVNPGCFMGLSSMLSILLGAREVHHEAHQAVSRGVIDELGSNTVVWRRDRTPDGHFYPAAQCSCKTTQAECNHHLNHGMCAWSAGGGYCTPAAGPAGFEGIAGYAGQRIPPAAGPRRPGSRYNVSPHSRVEWRRAGKLARIRAWDGSPWP